jgi:hypothetical protein
LLAVSGHEHCWPLVQLPKTLVLDNILIEWLLQRNSRHAELMTELGGKLKPISNGRK